MGNRTMRIQLTDRFCASAKSPHQAQTDYFDETVTGVRKAIGEAGKTIQERSASPFGREIRRK